MTITNPVTFTTSAINEITRLMKEDGFDTNTIPRVGVKGGGCSGLSYVLEFDTITPNDVHYEWEGIPFIMNRAHELYLAGMQIDWQEGLNNRGFTFSNPNASSTCGCGTSFAV